MHPRRNAPFFETAVCDPHLIKQLILGHQGLGVGYKAPNPYMTILAWQVLLNRVIFNPIVCNLVSTFSEIEEELIEFREYD